MKEGSTIETYEKILKFLEEKRQATYYGIRKHLNLSEKITDSFVSELSNKSLIKVINKPHKSKGRHLYEITIHGIEYLNRIETRKLQKTMTGFTYIIVTLTVMLFIIGLMPILYEQNKDFWLSLIGSSSIGIVIVYVLTYLTKKTWKL